MKPFLAKANGSVRFCLQKIVYYVKAYRRLELMARAASLSFYTMISIFPMIFILVMVSNWFLDTARLQHEVHEFLTRALPLESDLIWQNISLLFKTRYRVSVFNLAALFVSSQMLFVNMERIVNSILHTSQKRHFLKTRLLFLVWLTGMIAVLFSPILVTFASGFFKTLGVQVESWTRLSGHVGFFVASFLMFVTILLVVPRQKLELAKLVKGGLIFAVTVQIGKMVFKGYIQRNFLRYNLVYGSLSSTMLVMLWIFYFYNMFLFCVYLTGRKRDPLYLTRLESSSFQK